MQKRAKLILMRHGESEWNRRNLFTGWIDVPLSAKGMQEAIEGGKKIAHVPIDYAYTSSLIRAQMTALLALLQHSSGKVPCFVHSPPEDEPRGDLIAVRCAWQLNERMYGQLQGLNKKETVERFGEQQVQKWRRGFRDVPPGGESLEMTAHRVLPYFHEQVFPLIEQGHTVFIAAHGNSLRAIVMSLEGLSEEDVVTLEIPTGDVMIYQFESGKGKRILLY